MINTHWHTDHTDGSHWLHAEAVITAHENTRRRLSVDTRLEGWDYTFPAAPAGALPVHVFAQKNNMKANNANIVLNYYGPLPLTVTSPCSSSGLTFSTWATHVERCISVHRLFNGRQHRRFNPCR
ncbi:MAG: hypothetical protein H7Y20_17135 [Bryobacteraceae bacterium]|nr:hypothetical protein [Bryobacteraceae bacterium]